MSSTTSFPELEKLTTQISELVHNWGFKRIHGKIWTQLFLSERPLDAADLISQLDISKALVSISIRELLDVKAVEDVGRSQRGTHLYRANADLAQIGLELMKRREKVLLATTQDALSALKNVGDETLRNFQVSETQINALGEQLGLATLLVDTYIDSKTVRPAPEALHEETEQSPNFGTSRSSSNEGSSHSFTTVSPNGALPFSARASGD